MHIFISILDHYQKAFGLDDPIAMILLTIPNYFWTVLLCCALLPTSIFNLARGQRDAHAGLVPFVHLQLPRG